MSRFYNTVNAALAEQVSKDKAVSRDVLTVLRRDFQERYDVYLSEIGQLTCHDAIDELLERNSQECLLLERRLATAAKNNALLRKRLRHQEKLMSDLEKHRSPILRLAVKFFHALGIKNTGLVARLRRNLHSN